MLDHVPSLSEWSSYVSIVLWEDPLFLILKSLPSLRSMESMVRPAKFASRWSTTAKVRPHRHGPCRSRRGAVKRVASVATHLWRWHLKDLKALMQSLPVRAADSHAIFWSTSIWFAGSPPIGFLDQRTSSSEHETVLFGYTGKYLISISNMFIATDNHLERILEKTFLNILPSATF